MTKVLSIESSKPSLIWRVPGVDTGGFSVVDSGTLSAANEEVLVESEMADGDI
jgi:hypothetical protein